MANSDRSRILNWFVLFLLRFMSFLDVACGQIRYSIPEELKHGAFVGNIADDLGLNVAELSSRRFRIVSGARRQYLEVNLENGILFVNEKIDREQLCGLSPTCFLNLEVVIENPLELYQAEIEIRDVNDNAPSFPNSQVKLEITESAAPGARFPLESAQDPDVGTNSLRTYRLTPNEHFLLDVQTRSERSKFAELILEKPLDREQQALHRLLLTAVDGGMPEKSGTVLITVSVLDANDNLPVFEQSVYTVRLPENAATHTLVIQLNATDLDEGSNGRIVYSFGNHAHERVRELFSVEPQTGQVRVRGLLDYEEAPVYEIFVQAKDMGPNAVATHCNVIVEILDENDNSPEVILTSVSSPVPEDASPGTVIALISVTDRDTGANGRVSCRIAGSLPFKLLPSFKKYYTLVTDDRLDRETVPEYNITVMARDTGSPPLSSNRTITVRVSDVNDNAPRFTRPSYTVYVTENNPPGASICSVSAADPDLNQNSYLFYSILENQIQGMSTSTYVSINSDNGNIYALRSFDYEQLKNFQIQIQAQDAGFTPLSSNTTVNVFILDQNDNGPVIVSPLPRNGSVAAETVPRSAETGYLAVKVTAVDADHGQNARVSYRLLRATDRGLFNLEIHTGEIRMARRFGSKDSPQQTLIVQAKDNGLPPLSATVTIVLTAVDSVPDPQPDLTREPELNSDLTLYLIISLGSISFLFLVAIVVLALIRCHRDRIHGYRCSLVPCCSRTCLTARRNSAKIFKKPDVNLQLAAGTKAAPSGAEVSSCRLPSQAYRYKVCVSPDSAKSDFMFLKPCAPATPRTNNQLQGHNARVAGRNSLMVSAGAKAPSESPAVFPSRFDPIPCSKCRLNLFVPEQDSSLRKKNLPRSPLRQIHGKPPLLPKVHVQAVSNLRVLSALANKLNTNRPCYVFQVKQQNTDYHYPPFQRNTGSSSWDAEETGFRHDGRMESGKMRSAVTPPTVPGRESFKQKMASTNTRAPGQGVRNTIRVAVKDSEGGAPIDRAFFIKKILIECCGFQTADIFCLQNFPSNGYFEVTFKNVAGCIKFLKVFNERGNQVPLSILTVEPLFTLPSQRNWVVTIHLYNPHVPVIDVLTFLTRYAQVAGSSTDVKDKTVICKNCKHEGHHTKDCKQSKCCNLCSGAGHLYKTCSQCCLSYAQTARSQERLGEGMVNVPHAAKQTNNPPRCEENPSEKERKGEAAATSDPTPTLCPEAPPQHIESMEEEAAVGQSGQSRPTVSAGLWDTAPQHLQEMVAMVVLQAIDLVRGNDCHSSGLGILLRGGDFTISKVKEVVGGRLLVADEMYNNVLLRLINVYAPVQCSERLTVLQQLPLLLSMSRLVILVEASKIIFQSRVRSVEQDETCSSFFFLKVQRESSVISSLKEEDGSVTSSQFDILRISKSFYARLYDVKPMDSKKDAGIREMTIPGSGGTQVKVSLYMDDIAIFCSDLLSVRTLMSDQFKLASGDKVNCSKSEAMFFGNWADRSFVPVRSDYRKVGEVTGLECVVEGVLGRKSAVLICSGLHVTPDPQICEPAYSCCSTVTSITYHITIKEYKNKHKATSGDIRTGDKSLVKDLRSILTEARGGFGKGIADIGARTAEGTAVNDEVMVVRDGEEESYRLQDNMNGLVRRAEKCAAKRRISATLQQYSAVPPAGHNRVLHVKNCNVEIEHKFHRKSQFGPISENNRLTPSPGVDGHGWTPRYGPQYTYPDQPTGYKLNVYIPGSAPLKSSKLTSACEMDQNSSFSTFGKKTKLTSSLNIELNRTLT
ncbi:uncharacterized protein [Heterodontus francisci]|uniref:uncharacterized protein n=1 Tax=Heterodontus francisci TaxID=7792 RepID=UPI00355C9087